MGFPQGSEIGVLSFIEPLKSAVDEDVVDQKVADSISQNPQANEKFKIEAIHGTKVEAEERWQGKNEEKEVVFLEKMGMGYMVVFVEDPQKSMHHKTVGKPSHPFHKYKCPKGYP